MFFLCLRASVQIAGQIPELTWEGELVLFCFDFKS